MPNPLPERVEVTTLIKRLRRYAEIQDDTETRRNGRKATNTWAAGFREAADRIEQDAKRIDELEAALRHARACFWVGRAELRGAAQEYLDSTWRKITALQEPDNG